LVLGIHFGHCSNGTAGQMNVRGGLSLTVVSALSFNLLVCVTVIILYYSMVPLGILALHTCQMHLFTLLMTLYVYVQWK